MTARTRSRPLRVLLSMTAPDGTTRFVDQLVAKVDPSVQYVYWGWRNALLGSYDVFHVHWPEYLVRSRHFPITHIRRLLGALLILRLARKRTPVVRTIHNLTPHSGGSTFESWFSRRIDNATRHWIVLNEQTASPDATETTLIRHADYRELYSQSVASHVVPGRVLFFGRIDRYKGVDKLLGVFEDDHECALSLRIIGRPETDEWRDRVLAACRQDSRITATLGFVADEVLATELSESEVVALPYRELHNSGVLLLALSLGRPCIVPRTETTEALAREIGERWLVFLDSEIGMVDLFKGIEAARAMRGQKPTFVSRSLADVARGHSHVYARVHASRAGRTSVPSRGANKPAEHG